MTTRGQPLQQKARFAIESGGLQVAEFVKCSEIKWTAATVSQHSGGSMIPHKEPGKLTFDPITLERSLGHGRELYDRAEKVKAARQAGSSLDDLREDYELIDFNLDGSEARRIAIYNGFITSYSFGDRDNEADEFANETVIIDHDFSELVED
jgi:phage tail-like protein